MAKSKACRGEGCRTAARLSRSARPHRRAAQGGPADRGRPPDLQGHGDAPAGALAVPRRLQGERAQGVPVHQRARRQGQEVRHPRRRRLPCRQPRDLPHRPRLPARQDRRDLEQGREPIRSSRRSSRTRRARRSSTRAPTSTSPARASTASPCRSRRRAGTTRPTRRCRSTSPRTPTPACRTSATTAARSRRRSGSA